MFTIYSLIFFPVCDIIKPEIKGRKTQTKPERRNIMKKTITWIYENILTGKIVYSKKNADEIGYDNWVWDIIGEVINGEIHFY